MWRESTGDHPFFYMNPTKEPKKKNHRSLHFGELRSTRLRNQPTKRRYTTSLRTLQTARRAVPTICPLSSGIAKRGKRSKWNQARVRDLVSIGLTLVNLNIQAENSLTPRKELKSSIFRHGKRLTLDWDIPDTWARYLDLLRLTAYGRLLDCRRSSSNGGLHVVADMPDSGLNTRLLFGDDTSRAEKDQARVPYYRHVLFTDKGDKIK